MALTSTWGMLRTRWGNRAGYAGKALLYAMVLVVMTLSTATYARNDIWREEVRLWEDVVRKSPNKARPHYNLGLAYEKKYRYDEAINYGEAISEYQAAIKLNPNYADARNNLAVEYMGLGRNDEAIKELTFLLMIDPDYPMARRFLDSLLKKKPDIQN